MQSIKRLRGASWAVDEPRERGSREIEDEEFEKEMLTVPDVGKIQKGEETIISSGYKRTVA